MKYLILIILWSLWCLIHSGMISITINDFFKSKLRNNYKYYRLFYNLVSLSTLIPVVLYERSLKEQVLFQWQGYFLIIQVLLLIVVLLLFIAGGRKYDMLQLLGIRQIKSGKSHATLSESGDVSTSGILGITRHPWYLAVIILIWVGYLEMYISTLIVNIILTTYLIVGTLLEERKLVIELGNKYRNYQNRVSMIFPTKWILSKLFLAPNPDF